MKIILANPRGFLPGSTWRSNASRRALDFFGPPLYVYHEIVHNKFVVEKFRKSGTVFVESLDEVPPGSPLLYSAHGVSPQIREQARQRQLVAIDATCPLVIKVHLEAIRYAREGYTIFLIGHEGHDEVIGTMGEAPDQMHPGRDRRRCRETRRRQSRQGRLSDPDNAQRRRRQHRHRRSPQKVPQYRQPAQRRHLLRHAESPGGRPRAGGPGRSGPRAGEPEQLQQPSAGRNRQRAGDTVTPDRRRR